MQILLNTPTEVMPFDFAPLNNPILFINDAPEKLGGLSRIGRDIASLVCTMPEFRVGYLGRSGCGRSGYPWAQYSFPESAQWGEDYIASVWSDFSGGKPGIIMSLWDASRMLWFANPKGTNSQLERFLGNGRDFLKWGYFPVDAHGPNGYSYGVEMSAAIQGYDRVIAASEWGCEVLKQSGAVNPDWIPHGIWPNKFHLPYTGEISRFLPNNPSNQDIRNYTNSPNPFPPNSTVLGCVMTNQSRKDWPVAFECANILRQKLGNKFVFWAHVDRTVGYWNLYALASDYGMTENIMVTNQLEDWQLCQYYGNCDATILPSGGEGFGYPIAESMSCGTACVVTNYAAGQEIVDPQCRVTPISYRVDTQYNLRRPVVDPMDFARLALYETQEKQNDPIGTRKKHQDRVKHLGWPLLSTVWKKWFLKGIGR